MTGGRWFATGPTLDIAPSASTVDAGEAVRLAEARAKFYGSALVWRVEGGRAVLVDRVTRGGR